MRGSFNGSQSPYTFDHASAELQRSHRERREREAREDRACKWIAGKMVGQQFANREALTDAACKLVVAYYGRALTEDEHSLITRACRSLASGLVLVPTIAPVRCLVDRRTHVISFRAA